MSLNRKPGCPSVIFLGQMGEAAFREIESNCLRNVSRVQIIATGGGTPCFHENMKWINRNGFSIYLKTSPELLLKRLSGEMDHRPLIANRSQLELSNFLFQMISERQSWYEKAHLIYYQDKEDQDVATDLCAYFERIFK